MAYPKHLKELWMDGKEHTIRRGVHFSAQVDSMQMTLYRWANANAYEVHTRLHGNEITFRFTRRQTGNR